MRKARMAAGLLGCVLVWGTTSLEAAIGVADVLQYKPSQAGVNCSTPDPKEHASCELKVVAGQQRGSSGYLLKDPQGRSLRRFFDSDGDKNIDTWSYYLDGAEVYREIDTNRDKKPDQFRWLNANGMKWGIDVNGDGKIDAWKAISAEEVGQEVLQAVITRDVTRLQALWISESELKGLDLPAGEISRLHDLQKQAYGKFQNTTSKLSSLSDKTHFLRLETGAPMCVPADQLGGKQDLIKHVKATILYENGGKHDWLQIGEMIQVGLAWRIVDAPVPGDGQDVASNSTATVDPAVQGLLTELRNLDASNPGGNAAVPGPNPNVVRFNLARADLLEQIVGKVKAEEREQWIRQVADCLSTAAQSSAESDKTASNRLVRLQEQLAKAMPGSALTAFVTFREMQADYAVKLSNPKANFVQVQEEWLGRLAKFVEGFPTAEDAPDALLQLGMVSEFVGKEIEAKKWYENLVKNFGDHQLAVKARGALKRLDLEGKPLDLNAPMLQGGTYNIGQARGKVAVVYYWASWNQQSLGDFAKLKLLQNTYGEKLELVCVNLDNTAQEATAFLQRSPAPGTQVFVAGGLESPLATQYGIMVLPNLFVLDKEGKVVNRAAQMNSVEEDIKKALK